MCWVWGGWGEKKTKLMLYSTLVEIEVEVGVELGNFWNAEDYLLIFKKEALYFVKT